ncbi:MarR family winged helix-turn-helix transcriptional regulator [Neorhizobium galegae]|nr:MarR family winged helix-turn-helix transcriptional regulator [Neorhizobium galegae]
MAYFPEALIPPQFLRAGESGVVSPNERSLLKLIWRHPGLSRSEVTAHTDLTQQSVYRIIDQLAERGVVLLGSPKPGVGRGQPSPTIRLNARYAYSCGISVNTDVIGICLMDLAGNVLAESSVTLREHTMAQSLDLVRTRLAEAQKLNDLSPEALFGIGFAIAGYHVGGTRYNAPPAAA